MKKQYIDLEITLTFLLGCDVVTLSADDEQGGNDLTTDDIFGD